MLTQQYALALVGLPTFGACALRSVYYARDPKGSVNEKENVPSLESRAKWTRHMHADVRLTFCVRLIGPEKLSNLSTILGMKATNHEGKNQGDQIV